MPPPPAPCPPPKNGECADRREQILETATRLFAEHGYSEAVTQLLADELGVGKGTLYRHFPSKRDLFLAATDRVMRRLHDRVEESADGVADPLERVARASAAYLAFFDEHPESLELLIQERAGFKDRERPTYFAYRERNIEHWRDLYRGLMAEGKIRAMPAERITDVFSAAIYGAMFLRYFGGRSGSFAATAADILDVIFFGILTDDERAARLGDAADTKAQAEPR